MNDEDQNDYYFYGNLASQSWSPVYTTPAKLHNNNYALNEHSRNLAYREKVRQYSVDMHEQRYMHAGYAREIKLYTVALIILLDP